MDQNKKLFKKLSIFDIIVALLIVVVGAGTAYKFRSEQTNVEGGQKMLEYTVRVSNVRDFTLPYYQVGQRCFDSRTGEEIGKIIAVRSEPFTDIFQDNRGNAVLLEIPEKLRIEVDIETLGLETDRGYYAGGTYELKAGSEVHLSAKYIHVVSIVDSIRVRE